MGQSNVIASSLAVAFLMFITLRGELPDYLKLFKPQPKATPSDQSGGGSSGGSHVLNIAKDAGEVISVAKTAASFAKFFAI